MTAAPKPERERTEHDRRVVAAMPPLTKDQARELALLFHGALSRRGEAA